jgi:hypothetical protein
MNTYVENAFKYDNFLNLHEYININLVRCYLVTRFWNITDQHQWYVIDYELLRQIGCNNADMEQSYQLVKDIVFRTFESRDYKLSFNIMDDCVINDVYTVPNTAKHQPIQYGDIVHHLVVSPKTLDGLLRVLNTPISNGVRNYFKQIADVHNTYSSYKQIYREQKNESDIEKLIRANVEFLNMKPKKKHYDPLHV